MNPASGLSIDSCCFACVLLDAVPANPIHAHAVSQGVFATACLPALFTLCAMLASAWTSTAPADTPRACSSDSRGDLYVEGECYADDWAACGRLRLEELALAALWRAAGALWGLALRVVSPEVGDGPAAAVSVISLCSVAFFAVPTFRALEDAERTYQVGGGRCVRGGSGKGERER